MLIRTVRRISSRSSPRIAPISLRNAPTSECNSERSDSDSRISNSASSARRNSFVTDSSTSRAGKYDSISSTASSSMTWLSPR